MTSAGFGSFAYTPLKTSPRQASQHTRYARGVVTEVSGLYAVVRLSNGQEIRARADLSFGKGGAPEAGEHWLLDQSYGQWIFAVCLFRQERPALRFATTIGDGTSTSFTLPHNLNTSDLVVQCWDLTSWGPVDWATADRSDPNNLELTFATALGADSTRVVLLA